MDPAMRRPRMKALFTIASLAFLLFSGLLRGESDPPASRAEEVAQLRKQVETLEQRVEWLERRVDRMSRPRMVPLICIGMPRELP
jgi:cell division protein FtsB